MRLVEVVSASADVTATSGRLEKIAHLADLIRRTPPDQLPIAIAFLTGSTRQGRVGIGGAALRALRDVPPADAPTLDLADVDTVFARVGTLAGSGSAGVRQNELRDLFSRATRDEQDFLARVLFGELRQGALEGVLVEAIARASGRPSADVRQAAAYAGALAPIAVAAMSGSPLSDFVLRPQLPVSPMLAESADSVDEAIAQLGEASFEYKFDGARIQVHKVDDDVRVYSRSLSEVTNAVPEIVEIVRAMPARSLVLDGEAIAMRANGAPHPFQTTMRRFGRRLDVDRLRTELPITPFFFDVLHVDGHTVVDDPLSRRVALLGEQVSPAHRVPRLVTGDAAVAAAFAERAIAVGHEGVMAKAVGSPYTAGRRGQAWVKVKRARTLDLVILAAEWGSGRRQGTLSNLHLGARDPEHGGFVMLGKTFKGLTDELLAWQTKRFLELEIGRDAYTVYVRPELVAEIAFNEIQASPRYPGGVTLRFARVKRYRSDKTAADADTIATVRGIYESLTR